MNNRLHLSPKNKRVGLFIYCNKCKNEPKGDKCKLVDKKCPYPEKQVYKLRIHVQGTKRDRVTKVLHTRDEKEAAKQASELYGQFKNEKPTPKPTSLTSYFQRFIEFKASPTKNRKPISKGTIGDYRLHLQALTEALEKIGVYPDNLTPYELTTRHAQAAFDYIKGEGRTKEKYFQTYRRFYNYLIKEEGLLLKASPFVGWHFEKKEVQKEVIYQKEFVGLLKWVDKAPKSAVDSAGKYRLHYYPWLKTAFRFALYSGARRQEVPEVRWKDIIPNRITGKLPGGVVKLQDIKITNIGKLSYNKIKPVEINEDLAELLMHMGWKDNRGSDAYLFDPEEDISRENMKNTLSRSFSYYIKFASKRALTFGCLRKTWFTNCSAVVGQKGASLMGGHSGPEITVNHYINEIEAIGASGRFKRVFPPSGTSLRKLKAS